MNSIHWFSKQDIVIQPFKKHTLDFDPHFPLKIIPFDFSPGDADIIPNCHDYLEFLYIYEGSGTYTVNNNTQSLDQDDILLLGPAEFHTFGHIAHKPYKAITLAFLPELYYSPGGNPLDSRYLLPFQGRSPGTGNKVPAPKQERKKILHLLLKMMDELDDKKIDHKLAIRHKLSEIILIMLAAYAPSLLNNRLYAKQQEKINRLGSLFDHLKKNHEQRTSLDQMAQLASMSPTHFCRFFREVTGKTPSDYVVCIRIDTAKQLLKTTSLSVLDIVYKSGFNNPGYFYRAFQEKTHLTPKQFRALGN